MTVAIQTQLYLNLLVLLGGCWGWGLANRNLLLLDRLLSGGLCVEAFKYGLLLWRRAGGAEPRGNVTHTKHGLCFEENKFFQSENSLKYLKGRKKQLHFCIAQ